MKLKKINVCNSAAQVTKPNTEIKAI